MSLIDLNNIQRMLDSFYSKIKSNFAPKNHGTHLTLGISSATAFRGDYGNTAYNHSQAAHAPSNAQKNSDITKAEIEAKLTGNITSHNHNTFTAVSGFGWTSATRNIIDDCKFEFASHVNKDVTGKFPCGNNANAIISFNKHSGNYASQLGFSNNGNIYYRSADGAALTDSTAWQTIYTTSNKPTPADIGAATSSHGTHVTYSTSVPLVAGTASAGTSGNVSRGDHVHPAQTSVSGNAGTATKLATARKINGTSFNGSADITTANWGTARNITISDSVGVNTGTAVSVNGSVNVNLKLPATISASLSGNATTATTLATARTINGTSFNGAGNITTANWGTARTLTIGNKGKSVNGSGNVSWTLSEIGAFSSGGGDLGGNLHLTKDNAEITGICGGGTDRWGIIGGGANDNGYLEICTKDNGNEPIYVRQYNANGLVRTAALLDGNGATSFPGLISEGGTKLTDKYAPKSHSHNEIWVKDAPFNSSNDTTANWSGQGVSVSWYPDGTTITDKPNNWGLIFNIAKGTEVHQMWFTQATGSTYHRGGNGSGWSGSWIEYIDTNNYTKYVAPASHTHNYLSTGGGALSGPIDVNGECKFYNGTYSDPWNGTGCAIKATGNIAATGIIKANGRMDIQGIPLSIQSSAPTCGGVWIQI